MTNIASHMPLAAEPVALPCSMMKCGDVVYRSTLDPVLRREVTGPDWRTYALLASVAAYLFFPPGVLPGFIDALMARAKKSRAISKDDIKLEQQLASGGFGTVYKGTLDGQAVVVKKAKEFGEAEVWMNERMMRQTGGQTCAEFIAALDDPVPSAASPLGNAVWLVWKYEGDSTLSSLMEKRNFPANLEAQLFDRELRLPKGPARNAATIRLALKQLLTAVKSCHSTGIVHRDIKPQNCIVSSEDGKLKLIDLGAAADLRVGINYAPREYLLDPRYAPPQQYVMSTSTARPPPAPVAAFLSPVLWRMENPDKFDMYSVGVTLLQMSFPSLRTDNQLIAFRRRLEDRYKWDLRAWRRGEEGKTKDLAEGFALLDLNNGAGWDLLCRLMAFKPTDRPSAADALSHPFITTSESALAAAIGAATRGVDEVMAGPRAMLDDAIMSGAKEGQLSEASLMEELGLEESAPRAPSVSSTIAWWQERQADANRRLSKEGRASSSNNGNSNGVAASASKRRKPKARVEEDEDEDEDDARMKLPSFFFGKRPPIEVKQVEVEEKEPEKVAAGFSFFNRRK